MLKELKTKGVVRFPTIIAILLYSIISQLDINPQLHVGSGKDAGCDFGIRCDNEVAFIEVAVIPALSRAVSLLPEFVIG